jgi:choline transport protein
MYHWAAVLAPPKWAPILSWITGWNTIWAYVTSVASVCCVSASQIIALVSLAKGEDWVVQRWHIFLTLELLNIASFLLVVYGNRVIPMLQKVSLWWYLASFLVVSITVLVMAPTHRTGNEVFVDFINNTGWSTTGMAFISGLVNPAFSVAVLDATTHLSEEVPQPERNVPKAIFYTLFAALIQGALILMALFFSYQDLEGLIESPTWLPVAELFRQATGSAAGAFGLTFLLMISAMCTVWNCQLSQGRIYWAFARDNAVPFSPFFAHVSPGLGVPFRAHLLTAVLVALLGILYMWAHTAFNAFIVSWFVLSEKREFTDPMRRPPISYSSTSAI